MKCSNCGKEAPESANVCGYCGTRLKQAQPVRPAAETPKPAPQKAAPEPAVPVEAKQAREKGKLPKWALPAGLIAVGLAAAALILLVLFKPSSQPQTASEAPHEQSAPQAQEAQADADSLDFLAGTWSGYAVSDGDGGFEITFRFNQGCHLNEVCGSFDIPSFECSGDVAIFSAPENKFAAGNKYEFRVSSLSSGCGEGRVPEEWLSYINSKELEYYSSGDYGVSQGRLYKQ